MARPTAARSAGSRALQVRLVRAGDDEQLVGRAAPERCHRHDAVVGQHEAGAVGQLGLGGGAQDAAALEAGERLLLLDDLAGHERHAEQLAVRMGERRPGLAATVHDGLRVAHVRGAGVLLHAVAQRRHHETGGPVVEVGPAAAVVAGEHEHLVDAAGRRLHVDRPEVAHRHRVVRRRRRGTGWARCGCSSGRRGRRSRTPAAWLPRCRGRTGTAGWGRPRSGGPGARSRLVARLGRPRW